MKLIGLVFVGVMALAPTSALANVPRSPTPDPCTLCNIDPAVLTVLIESCQGQPEGAACQVLLILAGAPAVSRPAPPA